jgi:hypothetical protein
MSTGCYLRLLARIHVSDHPTEHFPQHLVNRACRHRPLVGPESDLAAAAAYKPPSMWSALLSGLGSIGVGAGAKGGPYAGFNYPTSFAPDLSGDDVSLSEAAKAGVQSGLSFNPTGTVF